MHVEDLPDRQMAAWLTGGEGTWIQADPTWGVKYAIVKAEIDDSLRMLPYLVADGTSEGGDWLRGVDPGAVASVRYGRRQIYTRTAREAPRVATTAQLKGALAERGLFRASAPATGRTATTKRKGIK